MSLCKLSDILPDFNQIFHKILNIKFKATSLSGSQPDTFGQTARQTDEHDKTNRRFSRLYKRV